MKMKITWTLKNQLQTQVTDIRDMYESHINQMLCNKEINGDEWIELHRLIQERWHSLCKVLADAWYNGKELDITPNWVQDNLRLCEA